VEVPVVTRERVVKRRNNAYGRCRYPDGMNDELMEDEWAEMARQDTAAQVQIIGRVREK